MFLTERIYVEFWPCCQRPWAVPFCRKCKRPLLVSVSTWATREITLIRTREEPPL